MHAAHKYDLSRGISDTWQAALAKEMASADLGEPRLARRLGSMVERLAERPDASFPKVFDSAALEAAYRFFGNVAVTPDAILSGHFEGTRKRSIESGRVLVVHDSTTLSFRVDGQRRGLGRLVKSMQSFYAHVSLVVQADGTRRPLGVAALKTWVRTEGAPSEQLRWGEQVEAAASRLEAVDNVVHVMDRRRTTMRSSPAF